MAESTTMTGMNDTAEPVRIGDADALATLQRRLEARGVPTEAEQEAPGTRQRETAEEAQERRQRRMEGIRARWERNVPALYHQAATTELDERQHAATVRGWLHGGGLHLVLAGPVGTGKTFAAYAVGNQALERGVWVEAYNVGDLMDALRPGAPEARTVWDRVRSCQLLVLDDLVGKATDWEAERMTLLLDARVREQRRTIITTNITAAQITETWGTRLMDRLRYRMTPLTFSGDSRRDQTW